MMLLEPAPSPLAPSGTIAERGFKKAVLRLVKGGPERLAIEAGQIDAIIDPASGHAILLPDAQRALIERKAPNRYASTVLDSLDAAIAVLDHAGVVLAVNPAWRALAINHSGITGVALGSNYLAGCDNAGSDEHVNGMAIAAGIRQVIAGERALFRYDYACGSPAGQRWFTLGVAGAAGHDAASAIVSCEDITERRRGEFLLDLERTVLRCLADADTAAVALKSVIRAVCESQGWNCGRYFFLDQSAGVLRFRESWGIPVAAVEQFLEKSRGLMFHPGAGLAGRVCQSGQPLWTLDGTRASSLSPTVLAPETGEEGAFVFPVSSEDTIFGVLAFSNPIIREPDDRTLQVVRSIGSHLGRFLHRQEVVDALRRSETRFRALTVMTSDWHWEQDRDFRFTQSIEGRPFGNVDIFGMTHWDLPNVVLTDAKWAEHKCRLAARWSFSDFEFAILQPDGQHDYYSVSGEPVYDEAGTFSGYCGTGLDITTRKRAEIALRDSEARLRTLAGLSSD